MPLCSAAAPTSRLNQPQKYPIGRIGVVRRATLQTEADAIDVLAIDEMEREDEATAVIVGAPGAAAVVQQLPPQRQPIQPVGVLGTGRSWRTLEVGLLGDCGSAADGTKVHSVKDGRGFYPDAGGIIAVSEALPGETSAAFCKVMVLLLM